MSDQGAASEATKAIGDPLGTFVGWLAGLLPEGPGRTLVYVVVGLCLPVAIVVYKYYLGLLAEGGEPEGSLERQDYDKLRASLAGGNLAARLYAKWLTAYLDQVERFFGDAGMADRTLFPRAFGLKTPAPLWTAPAFDRCLLLALIYPIATIFLIWAIFGHVGPAEAALGLKPDIPGWARGLSAGATGLLGFVVWCWAVRGKWEFLPGADTAAHVFSDVFGVVTTGGVARGVAVVVACAVVVVVASFVYSVVVTAVAGGVVAAVVVASAGAVVVAKHCRCRWRCRCPCRWRCRWHCRCH
jgi:hypothetical protein